MTVYTGRGDAGETDLFDGTRVEKSDRRVAAYGTVDELNALVGLAHPTGHVDLDDQLVSVQNHLHVVQAELANPVPGSEPAVEQAHVDQVEAWIDDIEAELPAQTAFVLPGGGPAGSRLHHARTVCRRAERQVSRLTEAGSVGDVVLAYLNRLSDLLYVQARAANHREDVPERNPTY